MRPSQVFAASVFFLTLAQRRQIPGVSFTASNRPDWKTPSRHRRSRHHGRPVSPNRRMTRAMGRNQAM
jgi:hypothetical protein